MSIEKISVVVPARNEENFLGTCLDAVEAAAARVEVPVEVVVVLNRCTDSTAAVAESHGACIVEENAKNLAAIRNAGVRAATGDVLVTIDADSRMAPNLLRDACALLETGEFVGGGAVTRLERYSVGIVFSLLTMIPYALKGRVSTGAFWVPRHHFEAVGGFDQSQVSAEDYYFAIRLKEYGRARGLRYGTVRPGIVTSCRKFDRFGDWYFVRNPGLVRSIFRATDQVTADAFYYEVER